MTSCPVIFSYSLYQVGLKDGGQLDHEVVQCIFLWLRYHDRNYFEVTVRQNSIVNDISSNLSLFVDDTSLFILWTTLLTTS